jgi:hypothetical protein
MIYVVPQIVDKLGVRVVCYNDPLGTVEGTDKAGKARSSAKLEYRFPAD